MVMDDFIFWGGSKFDRVSSKLRLINVDKIYAM